LIKGGSKLGLALILDKLKKVGIKFEVIEKNVIDQINSNKLDAFEKF